MAMFYARMMDAKTGGEGSYSFEGPDDLMSRTADEIVTTFFDHVDKEVLHNDADWEVNGLMNSREHKVVTALGTLIAQKDDAPVPFLLMISDKEKNG